MEHYLIKTRIFNYLGPFVLSLREKLEYGPDDRFAFHTPYYNSPASKHAVVFIEMFE